jgi:hypothetical protein
MTIHPITQNIKTALVYAGIWSFIIFAHTTTLVALYEMDMVVAIVDAIVFNSIYAGIGLVLWYPVFYIDLNKYSVSNLLINHVSILALALTFWISLSMFITRSIFPESVRYIAMLDGGIPWRVYVGIFYYFTIVLIYYLFVYTLSLKEHIEHEAKLKQRINEAELNALKSQINPHFLFNSLNSISSLTITNPENAHEMLIKLSGFLRYSLSNDSTKLIPLSDELSNMDAYVAVEKVRFGEKLIFKKEVSDECVKRKVPFLILQPLIENAIKHGVYESLEPVTISISCKKLGNGYLEIVIGNNYDPNAIARKGTNTGLKNIKDRLRLVYGMDDLFFVKKEETYFEVSLSIPPEKN